MDKTVFLQSLGCDKNLVDSEIMLGLLYESGFKQAADESLADVIVVNTCGFIKDALEEGIETILSLAEQKKYGCCKKLIVTGCMAQRYRDEIFSEIPEVDAVLGVNDFHAIAEAACSEEKTIRVSAEASRDILDDKLYKRRVMTAPTHIAYVKIAEGCGNRCTYCAIPSIRGEYRSREFEHITEECKRLIAGGARELVLVAQDTALYGVDLYGKPRLHELLAEIARLDGPLAWVRILYAYPEHIYPELIEAIAAHKKICKYLDMPIQHSHNEVLRRMGRGKSTNAGLRSLIAQLRERVPGISLRTTLIAGFPGETPEESDNLMQFVREARFEHLGVFAYSKEEGTPAARIKPQIPEHVKKAGRDALMRLQAEIAAESRRELIGRTLTVMVDGSIETKKRDVIVYSARSERDAFETDGAVYFESAEEYFSGDLIDVRITAANGYDLYGTPCGKGEGLY